MDKVETTETKPSTELPLLGKELSVLIVEARTEKQLSLDDVVERLKISKKHLEYFESEALDVKHLDPFQRGYIRNYAELLELKIDKFEEAFPDGPQVSSQLQSVEQSDSHASPLISAKSLKFIIAVFIVILAIILILINL